MADDKGGIFQEFDIILGADTSKANKQLQQLGDTAEKVIKEVGASEDVIQKSANDIETAAKKANEAFGALYEQVQLTTRKLLEDQTSIGKLPVGKSLAQNLESDFASLRAQFQTFFSDVEQTALVKTSTINSAMRQMFATQKQALAAGGQSIGAQMAGISGQYRGTGDLAGQANALMDLLRDAQKLGAAASDIDKIKAKIEQLYGAMKKADMKAFAQQEKELAAATRSWSDALAKLDKSREALGAAVAQAPTKMLATEMERLNLEYRTGVISLEAYRREMMDLMPLTEGVYRNQMKLITALEHPPKTLVAEQALASMKRLETAFRSGQLAEDQYIAKLNALRPALENDEAGMLQLTKAIQRLEMATDGAGRGVTFLGQAFKTAKHHAIWMFSGELLMPLYNLPREVFAVVKELDASFAKLKSQFETKPEFAGNIDLVNKKMQEMTKWSFDFARYYGEEIKQVNEVMYQASKVYSETADIIVASNAGLKLSIMDMTGADSIEAMKKFIAVTQQLGIAPKDMDYFVNQIIEAGHLVRATSGEIMDALARSASVFKTMGADATTAITIIALSLQKIGTSAETAGVSWKTLLQRMGDPKLGKLMKEIGINMYDANGASKDFGDTMVELMAKFAKMSDQERAYFTKQVAGIRQGNVLVGVLNATAKEYDHLSKTISGTPELLESRVAPAIQTQLDTVARKIVTLSAVWQAFVYQIMGSENAKKLLFEFLNGIVTTINFIEKNKQTLKYLAEAIIAIGAAFYGTRAMINIANVGLLQYLGLSAAATTSTGTLTLTMQDGSVAMGTFATSTNAASVALVNVMASMAGLLSLVAVFDSFYRMYKQEDYSRNVVEPVVKNIGQVDRDIQHLRSQLDGGKKLKQELNALKLSQETGVGAEYMERKYAKDYTYQKGAAGPANKIKELEAQISRLKSDKSSVDRNTIQKEIDSLEGKKAGLQSELDKRREGFSKGAAFDFTNNLTKQLLEQQKLASGQLAGDLAKRNFGLDMDSANGAKEAAKKFREANALVKEGLDDIDNAVKRTSKHFADWQRQLEESINAVKADTGGLYGEMIRNQDVAKYLIGTGKLFPEISLHIKDAHKTIQEYNNEIAKYKIHISDLEKKLANKKLTNEQHRQLSDEYEATKTKVEDVRSKIHEVEIYINELQRKVPDLVKSASEQLATGLESGFKRIDDSQTDLARNSRISATVFYQAWISKIQDLENKFPQLWQVASEMRGRNPLEYIAGIQDQIYGVSHNGKSALENGPQLLALREKLTAAEQYYQNVIQKEPEYQAKINAAIQAGLEIDKSRYELRKNRLALSGDERKIDQYTIEALDKEIQQLQWTAFWSRVSGDEQAYYANMVKASAAEVEKKTLSEKKQVADMDIRLSLYDQEIERIKEITLDKQQGISVDQQALVQYNSNVAIREQLQSKLAELEGEHYAKYSSMEKHRQDKIKETRAAILELNRTIYSTVPMLSEVRKAADDAYSSMRDNIKQTFTDMLDSSKSFMESITAAMKRQGDIMKNSIINALTSAVMHKYGNEIWDQAQQSASITAGIFKLFGLEAPASAIKPEEVWRKSFDTSKNALRVTSADSGGGSAGSTGGILGGFVTDAVTNALTGGAVKAQTSSRYKAAAGSTGGGAAYSNLETLAAIGMQYYAQQNPEIAAGPGYNILSTIGAAIGGPIGMMAGALIGAVADNGLGVGRGQKRRDQMQAQQESRAQQIKDIQSRYEALGLGTPTLNIPDYVMQSERSFLGLSGTSRWYTEESAAAVQEALDKEMMIVAHMEQTAKNLKDSMAEMNHSLAMGSPTFYTSGQTRGQDLTSYLTAPGTTINALAETLFGYRGKLWENMNMLSPTVNTLSSTIELLKYHLQELADAGMQAGEDFQQTSEQLMAAYQKQYWAGITSPTLIAEKNKFFGVGTDADTLKAYEDAVNKAFGHTGPVTSDLIAYFWGTIKDQWAMVQTGQLTGTAADQVTQQEALLEALKNLTDQISSNQLGAAATSGGTNLGEAISGNAQVVQNDITFQVSASNFFSTKTEMQAIAKELWLMVKSQGWVDPSVVMI